MKATGWVVLGALAAGAAVAACASGKASTALAGAVPAPNDTVGRFVWHDLVTHDVAASQKFYAALLGWEFETTTRSGRPYVIARSGGQATGGMVKREDAKPGPATWLSYLSVADLDRAVGQVTSAGGKVLLAPTAVDAYGRVAVVLDPQGAPLGLAGVTGTLPAEPAQPPLNGFFWMEHLAKDGPSALAFYKGLAGYESVSSTENGLEYSVLKRLRSRAGLLQLPPQFEGVEPNWLPYVRVEDPAALTAKALSLGAKIVIEPRADVRKGTLAIVTDPTGAALALQKWPLSAEGDKRS
jgi:predicted enzyme related to lactoylglutathione lyase